MSPMLILGSIPGTLDDVMYGMLSPSVEKMQLKTAYVEDGLAGWSLVSSIIKPSADAPFQELSLKWIVKKHLPLVGTVMRARDALYIDSSGITSLPSGEGIGYHLYHLVDIPKIRELTDLQIIRGRFSVCSFFRARNESSVELFGCGVFSPMEDASKSITAKSTSELAVSVFRHVHWAEMKKLTRTVCSGQ